MSAKIGEILYMPCPRCEEKTIQIFQRKGSLHAVNLGGKRKLRRYGRYQRLITSRCNECGLAGTKLRTMLRKEGYI